ncbi:MAG: hypothetical protein COB85_07015 [Bacteroidetes bacterium]|nr:MAG: hypothetical protein COB85_07015 [Bacteroidota bacterium]
MIKSIINKLLVSGSLVLVTCICVIAQTAQVENTSSDWIGAYLNVAGANNLDGVELSTQLTTCGTKEVVLLQFTNHNSYPVQIEWADAIYTKDRKWKHNETQTKEKIVTLKGNEKKEGDCNSQNDENGQLVVEINGIISSDDKFSRFAPSYYVVSNKSN